MVNKKKEFLFYYNEYKDKIFNYFWYRVGFNRTLAEDLTSEVFLKALKNFIDFDQARSFQAWIYKISQNHLINHYKIASREVELLSAENISKDYSSSVEKRLELEKVLSFINQMADSHKEVLLLRYVDGLENQEIAEVLNKDEGAARTQISRALEELRKNFN